MLGSWLLYMIIGLLGTGLAGLLATQPGQRWLRSQRRRLFRKAVHDTGDAWRARRERLAATPRGQLKSRRKSQHYRLTIGHVRTDDDPTVARKVVRTARTGIARGVERARLALENRTRKSPVLSLLPSSVLPGQSLAQP